MSKQEKSKKSRKSPRVPIKQRCVGDEDRKKVNGVKYIPSRKCWRAEIFLQNRYQFIGDYATKEEAEKEFRKIDVEKQRILVKKKRQEKLCGFRIWRKGKIPRNEKRKAAGCTTIQGGGLLAEIRKGKPKSDHIEFDIIEALPLPPADERVRD